MTTPLPPTDPPSADESLPGEAALAALYRQLPQNEPSPALDAAVLRAAAAALAESDDSTITERRRGPREPGDWVHPKMATQAIPSIDDAKRRARTRTPRWMITLGSAASLVLVAGLAWQLRESSPPPSVSAAQKAAFRTEAAAMAKANPESRQSTAAPSPASPAPAQLADQQTDLQASMQGAAAKKVQQDGALRSAQRQDPAKPMAAQPPADELAAPAPAIAAAAPPAPPALPAPVQEVSANAASGLVGTRADTPRAAKPVSPAAAPVAMNETASDKDTTQQPGDTPALELDKIQQLFAQGHHDQALQRLRAFHKAHPQWPLSRALQAQLREP